MKTLILMAAAISLGGCAARVFPAKVSGNETFVTVGNVWEPAHAMPYAEKHCAKYGRVPKFQRQDGTTVAYECVKSGG